MRHPFGIVGWEIRFEMIPEKNKEQNYYGDEAPGWKEFLVVIIVIGLITAASWIAWFKLGWLH